MPDTESPNVVGGVLVGLAVDVDTDEGLAACRRELVEEWLEAA